MRFVLMLGATVREPVIRYLGLDKLNPLIVVTKYCAVIISLASKFTSYIKVSVDNLPSSFKQLCNCSPLSAIIMPLLSRIIKR